MHITTKTETLLKSILLAERVTGKKESLPVLGCVVLEAQGANLHVKATNLETGVDIHTPAKVIETGVVAVPATLIGQILKNTKQDTVDIKQQEGALVITSKSGTATVKCIPHDEFPIIPTAGDEQPILLEKTAILQGIQSVAYAAAQSTIRPEFASVYLKKEDDTLTFAATDSFRLAEKKVTTPEKGDIPETLIPTKNALELMHVLEGVQDETVQIIVDDGQLTVLSSSIRFVSRIVDATFPNYQAIIPKTFTTEATVLKQDLVAVMRKTRLFAHTTQQMSFHVYPGRKTCTVTAGHQETGTVSEDLEAIVKGDDLDINFNIAYVADGVQTIGDDSVHMSFAGPAKPLVVRGMHDSSFTYLVMPLNR